MPQLIEPLPESPSLGATVARLRSRIASDSFPTGERAALRKQEPDALFRLFASLGLDLPNLNKSSDWRIVLAAIALNARTLNSPERVPLGRALASADFKDARLARLLNSRGDQFEALAVRAARFLAAKGQPADWTQYATLVLSGREGEAAEGIRLQIARDFFAAVPVAAPKES